MGAVREMNHLIIHMRSRSSLVGRQLVKSFDKHGGCSPGSYRSWSALRLVAGGLSPPGVMLYPEDAGSAGQIAPQHRLTFCLDGSGLPPGSAIYRLFIWGKLLYPSASTSVCSSESWDWPCGLSVVVKIE